MKQMFTSEYEQDEVISVPIAHGEGNYYCDEANTTKRLKKISKLRLRMNKNPNGSLSRYCWYYE